MLLPIALKEDLTDSVQGNAGDSRSVLGVKGRAKPLSFDHKPQNEGEKTSFDKLEATSKHLVQGRKRESVQQAVSSISIESMAILPSLGRSETLNSKRAPNFRPSNRSSPPSLMLSPIR